MNPFFFSDPTARFFCAWIYLNLLLNLHPPVFDQNPWTAVLPSPELTLWLLALCAAAWPRYGLQPIPNPISSVLFLFFLLFRLGEAVVPLYLSRRFNLCMDSRYLPDMADFFYRTLSLGKLVGFAALTSALGIALGWSVWRSFGIIGDYFRSRNNRRLFLAALCGYGALTFLVLPGESPRKWYTEPFFPRVVEEIDFILSVSERRGEAMEAIRASAAVLPTFSTPIDRLGGDVHLFLVESYGRILFSEPRYFSLISPALYQFEEALKRRGFTACSNFLSSPTFGGSSWLAFGTLESGIRLSTQMEYNLLIHSDVKTLARFFNEADYRTISVMPGTRFPWPEGAFFGYQASYHAWDFRYEGPRFGWSPMPDQFVLYHIFHEEIEGHKGPLFIRYVLVSSHAPFHVQPPYLEEWSRIGDGSIYSKMDAVSFPVTWPDLRGAGEAYASSIVYDLKVLASFVERYVEDDALVLILGDHQPIAPVSGSGSPWSVPIHLISKNPGLLEPFFQRGYSPGLIPAQPPPHRGMERFLGDFLEAFSSPR